MDLIVNRTLITHLNLYERLKPTCDKKISIMGLVYIINQWAFDCRARRLQFKLGTFLVLNYFLSHCYFSVYFNILFYFLHIVCTVHSTQPSFKKQTNKTSNCQFYCKTLYVGPKCELLFNVRILRKSHRIFTKIVSRFWISFKELL